MDGVLERISAFASELSFDAIPDQVVQAAKERLIDSLGCALGAQSPVGRGCETAQIGMRIASQESRPDLQGWIIGSAEPVAAESAAFVNGCLIRDLDFNDTYPGHHPSDCLAGLLGVSPAVAATGRDLITAMVISYETSIRLVKNGHLNGMGWDNGYATGIGATAAVARLMGLDRNEIRHAVSITATANVPMRAAHAGQLSMWKGAATAYSVRNAVFGAQLAASGMTGPEAPFTGRHGLMDLITGPIEIDRFGTEGGDFYLPEVKLKYWPVVYNMQALVWAGIDLRNRLEGRPLEDVEVLTYWPAWRESGSEPEKWEPQTRETADHSAPYILAYVLRNGTVGHEAMEPASFLDKSLHAEMKRIRVAVDDGIEAAYPEVIRMILRARDEQGKEYEVEVTNPPGHEDNPMSKGDIETKFRGLATPVLGDTRVDNLLDYWWSLETGDVATALTLMVH